MSTDDAWLPYNPNALDPVGFGDPFNIVNGPYFMQDLVVGAIDDFHNYELADLVQPAGYRHFRRPAPMDADLFADPSNPDYDDPPAYDTKYNIVDGNFYENGYIGRRRCLARDVPRREPSTV